MSLTETARLLSSGTMATLTDKTRYDETDGIRTEFVLWCSDQPDQQQPWQEAWATFWPTYQTLSPALDALVEQAIELLNSPHVPPTLDTLAIDLDTTTRADQAQRTKEKLETALKGKSAPRKTQSAPCGMFEQTQQRLFD